MFVTVRTVPYEIIEWILDTGGTERAEMDDAALQNGLLAALPASEWARIKPELERTEMPLGKVVHESGAELRHVYFPTTCIVSLLYVMEDGLSAEIGIIGLEGLVGIALFMGGESTPSRAVVQSAGTAYRLAGRLVKDEFFRGGQSL